MLSIVVLLHWNEPPHVGAHFFKLCANFFYILVACMMKYEIQMLGYVGEFNTNKYFIIQRKVLNFTVNFEKIGRKISVWNLLFSVFFKREKSVLNGFIIVL